jgi:small multidrug resistance pump
MNYWIALAIAIITEVMAKTRLKSTDNFTPLWPSVMVITGYSIALYFMTLSIKVLTVCILNGTLACLGIALVAILGWLLYGRRVDILPLSRVALIISGVFVIQLFAKSDTH